MTQAYNLGQFGNKVNTSGQADLTTAVTGTLPVANGGTGLSTLTANNVVLGNGASAVQFVAPGSLGNVLVSNGTTWTSSAIVSGGQYQVQLFTAPGTWTKPSNATTARITIIGGGGGGGNPFGGGVGGLAVAYVTGLTGPVAVTVGSGGTGGGVGNGTPGGTSSFGSFASATGGGGGTGPAIGTNGAGTVSTGTALITANLQTVAGPFSNVSTGPTPSLCQIVPNLWGVIAATNPGPAPTSYSQASGIMAGAAGQAVPPSPSPGRGGYGGVVIVEFVG